MQFSLVSRLQELRLKLKKRRFQKLANKYTDGDVHAYNNKSVKQWVSAQRRIGSRADQEYLMANI